MKIPTYEQQAQYQPKTINKFAIRDQTPDMRLNVTPEMFGGAQARIIGQASHDLQRGAALGMRAYAEWQDTKAQAAFNEKATEDAEALYGPEGIFTLKGEAAVDTPARLKKYMEESSRKYAAKAGGSLGQGYFQQRVDRQMQQLMPRAMQHATMEKQNFEIGTHDSARKIELDNALRNIGNPELFASSMAAALHHTTLMGQIKGEPPEKIEEMRRSIMSQGYLGKVQGLLTAGKIGDAQKTAHSGFLTGEDSLRAMGAIRTEQKRAEAEAKANAAEARVGMIVSETDAMFKKFGGSEEALGAGYDYIRTKYANDPKMRLHMESAFAQRVSMEEAADAHRTKVALKNERNDILQQLQREDITPAAASALVEQASPENQGAVASMIKKRFPSQEVFVSDVDKKREMAIDLAENTFVTNPEGLREKYGPYIADNELNAAVEKTKAIKDKSVDHALRANFNMELGKWDIDKLASDADMTKEKFRSELYGRYVSELDSSNITKAQDKRKYMDDFFKSVTLKRTREWMWNAREDVPAFKVQELMQKKTIVDVPFSIEVPPEEREEIRMQREARGLPVSNEIIEKTYRLGLRGAK